jgi:hypothetical protein
MACWWPCADRWRWGVLHALDRVYARAVPTDAALPDRRWRALADAVAAALGLNVWVTLILVPALFTGAIKGLGGQLTALVPLVALGIGLARRSVPWLLGVFPALLLVPIVANPRLVAGNVHGPWSFLLVSTSVVAYLFAVSWFSTFRDLPAPARTRSLAPEGDAPEVPARWRRRFRIYRTLAVLAVLLPGLLLHAVNFHEPHLEAMRDKFANRVPALQVLGNLVLLAVWLLLYSWAFVGVLARHRTGDRALTTELAAIRKGPARPRVRFYVWVVIALATMGALVLLRYR